MNGSLGERARLEEAVVGTWVSLAIELRPQPAPPGAPVSVAPSYLTREFEFGAGGSFLGTVTMYEDPQAGVRSVALEFGGHLAWGDPHPVAAGAYCVDYVCDTTFAITPMDPHVADLWNGSVDGGGRFAVGRRTSVLGESLPAAGLSAGQVVIDHDLILLRDGYLFMGAKHVDGSQFDTPANRPIALQVPLVRKAGAS